MHRGEQVMEFTFRIREATDGDTFKGDVILPWGICLFDRVVRVDDYDAWEISLHRRSVVVTLDELMKGKKALVDIQQLIAGAKYVTIEPGKTEHDVYGRMLGTLRAYTDTGMVKFLDYMKERGNLRS
jgi:hypothetical protein